VLEALAVAARDRFVLLSKVSTTPDAVTAMPVVSAPVPSCVCVPWNQPGVVRPVWTV
jgi:hypothetical protein